MNSRARLLAEVVFASIMCVGASCSVADEAGSCNSALRGLGEVVDGAPRNGLRDVQQRQQLDRAIGQVGSLCDLSRFEIGMPLADAYRLKQDYSSMAAIYLQLKPTNPEESEVLYFRATELFVSLRDKLNAEKYLALLKSVSQDPDYLMSAESGFQCAFGRCALALNELQMLVEKFPRIAVYHSLLGYSYADRHEFVNSALQFDLALQDGDFFPEDTVMGLVAVSSYMNTGQSAKAKRLYEKYSLLDYGGNEIDMRNLQRMKLISEDTSGTQFLFSEWPISSGK
jgi:Flp pilus assembly protein TadD